MRKTRVPALLLLLSLLCFHGCTCCECCKVPESNLPLKTPNPADFVEVVGPAAEPVIQIAIQKVDEERGKDYHKNYTDIMVHENADEWFVHLDRELPRPGSGSLIRIYKSTGEARYFQG